VDLDFVSGVQEVAFGERLEDGVAVGFDAAEVVARDAEEIASLFLRQLVGREVPETRRARGLIPALDTGRWKTLLATDETRNATSCAGLGYAAAHLSCLPQTCRKELSCEHRNRSVSGSPSPS
jgi:hypothetical protein